MEINELIRELRNRGLHNGSTLGHHSGLYEVAADAMEIQQKRIAELEEQRRWIPVTERLPDKDGFYIVVMNGDIWGEPDVWSSTACGFYDGRWDEDGATISHWMPLPEPPKNIKRRDYHDRNPQA